MPAKKKNTYEVEGLRTHSFEKAAGRAVDLSLESGEMITITEHGQTGTYLIGVTAAVEKD